VCAKIIFTSREIDEFVPLERHEKSKLQPLKIQGNIKFQTSNNTGSPLLI
jgi:hypothetical protein